MKVYKTNEIRNIALVGNASSGKTTIAEAMVFNGGLITRRGEVEKKNTVSDYREIEQAQGKSIFSSLLFTEYNNHKINILDAPGSDDFIGSAISSIYIADTSVLVLNAQNGVEVGTENAWEYIEKYGKPTIFLVNHLDHEHANFEKTIDDAKEILTKKVVIVQFPVNQGVGFNSVVDVIKMKLLKWNDDKGKYIEEDIPGDLADKAEEYRNALIEAAAESDESLMEKYFEEGTLTEEEIFNGLKQGLKNRDFFPVFCSAAKHNYGLTRLMEFIVNVAPAPNEMPPAKTVNGDEVPCDPNGPTALFVYKNTTEQHVGDVLYFKVMSGKVVENQDLINNNKQSKERLSQLLIIQGKKKEKVAEVYAGDLAATVKLKDTRVGHTLTEKDVNWIFPEIEYPDPKYWTAIKADSESDEEKLAAILNKYHEEDPTILVEYSRELKQTILRGQGEFHLQTVKWHLDNIFKIPTKFIPAKVPYRETITKPAWAQYRHKKQTGGAGQFGEVHLVVDPYEEGKPDPTSFKFPDREIALTIRDKQEFDLEWGGKFIFYNCIVGGAIDKNFMPAIIKGIFEKLENSPLTGSYIRDVRVAVFDGKMHPVDSNEISFKLAGRNAFDIAFRNANPKILEPIYEVEVKVPSEFMGDVMSDLQGRRAMILGMSSEGRYEIIKAKVPLAEMNRYATSLSSITGGRGTYKMKFSEYAQVPPDVQEKLVKEKEAEKENK